MTALVRAELIRLFYLILDALGCCPKINFNLVWRSFTVSHDTFYFKHVVLEMIENRRITKERSLPAARLLMRIDSYLSVT